MLSEWREYASRVMVIFYCTALWWLIRMVAFAGLICDAKICYSSWRLGILLFPPCVLSLVSSSFTLLPPFICLKLLQLSSDLIINVVFKSLDCILLSNREYFLVFIHRFTSNIYNIQSEILGDQIYIYKRNG